MKKSLLASVVFMIGWAAAAQAADGWKTILATPEELKDYTPKQASLEDGMLHVREGNGVLVPQPSADGAIRARFHFREGTGFPQLRIRRNGNAKAQNTDYYEVIFFMGTRQTSAKEAIVNATIRGKGKRVGVVPLAEPFALGGHVDMELSVLGDHLQVLVNGKLAFETHDSSISTGGYWGVAAYDAWFSNIQVRALMPKSTDPRIIQLEEAYESAIERDVTAAHAQAVQALDEKYLAALGRALDAATQAGNLDEATGLQGEKKRVEDKAALPADDSTAGAALKPLRQTYRQSLGQLELVREQNVQPVRAKLIQALTAYEEELTRAKNLEGAMQVRKRRDFEAAK